MAKIHVWACSDNELLALQKRKKESTTLGFLRSNLPDLRLSLCKMCTLFLSPSMHPATKITDSIFEDVHEKSTPWILQAAESTTVSKQSKRSSHPRFSWHIHSVVFPNNEKTVFCILCSMFELKSGNSLYHSLSCTKA